MPNAPLVMVVEDDEQIRSTLIEIIYEEGYDTFAARNGREALEYLMKPEARRPALILLDLLMPEIDGWEVLSELQGDQYMSSIPVCAISGSATFGPKGVRFMRKPLNLNALLTVIHSHCGVAG